MNYRILQPTPEQLAAAAHRDVFTELLRSALADGVPAVGVCLSDDAGIGTALVDWLESWQRVFAQKKRLLVFVTCSDTQRQHLELSHPEQDIHYVASIDELHQRYPIFSEQPPPPSDAIPKAANLPPQPIAHNPAGSEPVAAPAATGPQPVSQPDEHLPPSAPAPLPSAAVVVPETPRRPAAPAPVAEPTPARLRVNPGETMRISGEYACPGCNHTRMYAKGDILVSCSNPECRSPGQSWELVFELF